MRWVVKFKSILIPHSDLVDLLPTTGQSPHKASFVLIGGFQWRELHEIVCSGPHNLCVGLIWLLIYFQSNAFARTHYDQSDALDSQQNVYWRPFFSVPSDPPLNDMTEDQTPVMHCFQLISHLYCLFSHFIFIRRKYVNVSSSVQLNLVDWKLLIGNTDSLNGSTLILAGWMHINRSTNVSL